MSKLSIENTDFLINSLIERCSNKMMLRELFKNAIENTMQTSEKKIVIGTIIFDGVKKLRIWNSGPGMNARELRKACDISSSIGKIQSLDDNFGMGAKVASLGVNKCGMRYRSCKEGVVSEIVMGQTEDHLKNKIYARIDYEEDATGTDFRDVLDVTEIVKSEGVDVSRDWTEVVLFGNHFEQDTIKNPFDSNPKVPKRWISNSLYNRFFRLPSDLTVILEDAVQAKGGDRKFIAYLDKMLSVKEAFPDEVFYESVPLDEGIVVHYFFDGPDPHEGGHNRSYSGNTASDMSFCGVVFKDEIYDFRKSNQWSATAPKFNVSFGARHISIAVEIPDDANVIPDGYRELLKWNDQAKETVVVEQFGELIRENMPMWLKEKISEFSPKSSTSENVTNILSELLKEYQILSKQFAEVNKGEKNGERMNNKTGVTIREGVDKSIPKPPVNKSPQTRLGSSITRKNVKSGPVVPDFIVIEDEEKLKEHPMLVGRAARYVEESNVVYINMLYDAPKKLSYILQREYLSKGEPDLVNEYVKVQVEDYFKLRIGRAIIFALAKKSTASWTPEDMEMATRPECLTISADDFMSEMREIRTVMSNKFKAVA